MIAVKLRGAAESIVLTVHVADACAQCRQLLDRDGDHVYAIETSLPGFEVTGDPSRILGWHRACASADVLAAAREVGR